MADDDDTPQEPGATQHKRGRFKPGQSGNPKGPTPGRRHPAFAALDAIGQGSAEAVVQAVVTAAQAGDMRAAEILLRRVWPERKGRPLTFTLPTTTGTSTDRLAEAMEAIVVAMADGTMTPEEAGAAAGVLEINRRMLETQDHERRLKAIEDEKP